MNRFHILYIALLLATACGPSVNKEYEVFPDWINKQPALCAGGIHRHDNNISSGRTYAIAKARAELSRKIETKVKTMVQVYEQSGEESSKSFNESLYTNVISNLSKVNINGSEASKIETNSKYVFTLVCLNPTSLTKVFDEMNVLSESQRKALISKSYNMQREMENQLKDY